MFGSATIAKLIMPCPPGLIPKVAQVSVVVGTVYLVQVMPPSEEAKSPTRPTVGLGSGWLPAFSIPTKILPDVPTATLMFWVVPSINRLLVRVVLLKTWVQLAPQSFDL